MLISVWELWPRGRSSKTSSGKKTCYDYPVGKTMDMFLRLRLYPVYDDRQANLWCDDILRPVMRTRSKLIWSIPCETFHDRPVWPLIHGLYPTTRSSSTITTCAVRSGKRRRVHSAQREKLFNEKKKTIQITVCDGSLGQCTVPVPCGVRTSIFDGHFGDGMYWGLAAADALFIHLFYTR